MDLLIVKEALDKNRVLDQGVKDNILDLVGIFHKSFPDVDLNNLCQNLNYLKVEKTSSFVSRFPLDYNAKLNKITINPKELEKVKDTRNFLMNVVIRLIVTNNGVTGFDAGGKFLALNIGYIAGIANMLVGNEEEHDFYTDEIIAPNLFGKIVGDEVLAEAFFKNNPELIIDKVMKEINYEFR